jgi:hypothetical protein
VVTPGSDDQVTTDEDLALPSLREIRTVFGIAANVIGLVVASVDPSAKWRVVVTVLLFMAVMQVIVVTVDRRAARSRTSCVDSKDPDDG